MIPPKAWHGLRHSRGPPAATPAPAAPTEATSEYVVKESDSLWRIANDQLGDPGAVETIKELNKAVLKGGDTIHPNMRLRLPPKKVATAN